MALEAHATTVTLQRSVENTKSLEGQNLIAKDAVNNKYWKKCNGESCKMYFFKTMWKTNEMLELAYYFFFYKYCKVKILFCESLAFLVSHFHLVLRFLSFVAFILHRNTLLPTGFSVS